MSALPQHVEFTQDHLVAGNNPFAAAQLHHERLDKLASTGLSTRRMPRHASLSDKDLKPSSQQARDALHTNHSLKDTALVKPIAGAPDATHHQHLLCNHAQVAEELKIDENAPSPRLNQPFSMVPDLSEPKTRGVLGLWAHYGSCHNLPL